MNTNYWNSLASDFEDNVLEIANHDLNGVLEEQIMRVAKKGAVAADLGCGTGSLLPLLHDKFDTVFAVDYADELLNVAREKNHYENVEYICHDLVSKTPLPFTAEVVFSINALISTNHEHRQAIAQSLWSTTSKNGCCVVVVPSMESVMHVYQALVRCNTREEMGRRKAVSHVTRTYQKEVLSPVDGIVSIGGTPTKCFTREELSIFLSDTGFNIEALHRVEFPWEEEIDDAPRWLKGPYPWDWLIIGRKE
ncbi:class I SAM-dependent methyltransferase [Kaarinaea lacus]